MSQRRTFAALVGTALLVLVVFLGAAPAGATTGTPVVENGGVPAAVGLVPAQPPAPAEPGGAVLADVLCVAGFALFVGGVVLAVHASGVRRAALRRPVRVDVVVRGQLLAS